MAGTRDLRIETTSECATEAAGELLGSLVRAGDVVLLSGDLGAGKTHLTKGVAVGLGIRETVTSPTFNIMLVHGGGRLELYHIDLYRLDDAGQLEGIGYFDALDAGGVSVVEWGDRFPDAAPDEHLAVSLHIVGDEERALDLLGRGERGEALAREWVQACEGLNGVRVTGGAL